MLNILTAHKSEANAFIRHYRLEVERVDQIDVYYSNTIRLFITGQGKHKVVKAMDKFLRQYQCNGDAWFNFGVAGASGFNVGEMVVAEQVIDGASREQFLVKKLSGSGLQRAQCISVARPETEYPESGMYDMEAAAICRAIANATRHNAIHVVKLITDGPDSPLSNLTMREIKGLLASNYKNLIKLSDSILASHTK